MSEEIPPTPPDAEGSEAEEGAEAVERIEIVAQTTTGQIIPSSERELAPLEPPSPAQEGGRGKAERPRLELARDPLYRSSRGYRMRLEPADLARLRELPGSKGRSDEELGETFFDGQSDRFTEALAEDVPAPAEIRVVVDPYSRQAFLALENKIRAILSF